MKCHAPGTSIRTVILLFVSLQAAWGDGSPKPPGVLISIGGRSLHLNCTGSGSPTVMVVGGAFSFDWALVQEQVARFTRVCTYDPSGTAPSDPVPQGKAFGCNARVEEIHRLQEAAGLRGPYILVGYSIGSLYARIYAQLHPSEVVGLVLVDHALTDVVADAKPRTPVSANSQLYDSPPVLLSAEPITLGLEDDKNFRRLPLWAQQMHSWAMSNNPLRPTAELADECAGVINELTHEQQFPLANKPLVVISTENQIPGHQQLQEKLLLLSRNSTHLIADKSSHAVVLDLPEVIVEGVRQAVKSIRKGL